LTVNINKPNAHRKTRAVKKTQQAKPRAKGNSSQRTGCAGHMHLKKMYNKSRIIFYAL